MLHCPRQACHCPAQPSDAPPSTREEKCHVASTPARPRPTLPPRPFLCLPLGSRGGHVLLLVPCLHLRDHGPGDGLTGGQACQTRPDALPQRCQPLLLVNHLHGVQPAVVLGHLARGAALRHQPSLDHVHGAVGQGAEARGYEAVQERHPQGLRLAVAVVLAKDVLLQQNEHHEVERLVASLANRSGHDAIPQRPEAFLLDQQSHSVDGAFVLQLGSNQTLLLLQAGLDDLRWGAQRLSRNFRTALARWTQRTHLERRHDEDGLSHTSNQTSLHHGGR